MIIRIKVQTITDDWLEALNHAVNNQFPKGILSKNGGRSTVENISEMFGYLATGRVNIRIHRDITGEMWFGV